MKQASENERERLEDERKREILWAGYNMSRREKANRGKIWKDYSTSSNNVP
jgi:formate-dependent nitrite reductase cytochrome c552 subunit